MFDLKAFADASVAGIPLVVFVLALTTWCADVVGAQGKQKMVIAMIIGLFFGGGYQLCQAWPTSFAGWFMVTVYGITLGLLGSGIWDTAGLLAEKAIRKAFELLKQ